MACNNWQGKTAGTGDGGQVRANGGTEEIHLLTITTDPKTRGIYATEDDKGRQERKD